MLSINKIPSVIRCRASMHLGLWVVASMLVGCQTPGIDSVFRLPGTPNLPAVHSAPTPKLTPGGLTPKVPGVARHEIPSENATEQIARSNPTDANTAVTASISSFGDEDQSQVVQVGLMQRLGNRLGNPGGRCQDCVGGADCIACESCVPQYGMMPGRPVDPQEYLCNGGDAPAKARALVSGGFGGLEPQDAVVQYTTDAGDTQVQASNRVCLYAPRFGAIRQVSGAVAGEKAIGLQGTFQPVSPGGIGVDLPSLSVRDIDELANANVAKRIDAMRDRNRGVPVEGIRTPVIALDVLQILATLDAVSLNRLDDSQIAILQRGAVAAQSWMIRDAVEVMIESMRPPTLIRDAKVEAFVRYDFPDAGRLEIIKVADKKHAAQGELVSFMIRVRNVGDSVVREVEIADSLVSRLEYVEDSQTCDREAAFEARGNSAGSIRMSWKLNEPLAVGETATIEFKCKVR